MRLTGRVACNLLDGKPMELTADIRRLLHRTPAKERLDVAAAARLWGALLDEALDDVEVGAIVGALAVCGETTEELMGLYQATQTRFARWPDATGDAIVSIPAYGLFAGECHIVALAAMLLRRFDLRVLVHGVLDAPCGLSCARVLRELEVMPSASLAQAANELATRAVAFVPVQLLSPPFARLLALRARLGIENSAHLVAQLVDPTQGRATRLVMNACGAQRARLDALVKAVDEDALMLTWPGDDPPESLALRPRIERCHAGEREVLFAADGPDLRAASLPAIEDAPAAAAMVRAMATGRAPVPVPALNLAAACLYAAGRAPDFARAKAAVAVGCGRLAA